MKKPNQKMLKEFEDAGVDVKVDDEYIRVSYYCEHGEEKDEEIPLSEDAAMWLYDAWNVYDVSEKTAIWLDEFGHGKNGAPYDLEDILEDQKEWEAKLHELYQIALKYRNEQTKGIKK